MVTVLYSCSSLASSREPKEIDISKLLELEDSSSIDELEICVSKEEEESACVLEDDFSTSGALGLSLEQAIKRTARKASELKQRQTVFIDIKSPRKNFHPNLEKSYALSRREFLKTIDLTLQLSNSDRKLMKNFNLTLLITCS
jgi:hypothetical protein